MKRKSNLKESTFERRHFTENPLGCRRKRKERNLTLMTIAMRNAGLSLIADIRTKGDIFKEGGDWF